MSLPITAVGPLKVLMKPILTGFCCAKTVPAGRARNPARGAAPAPASISRNELVLSIVFPPLGPARRSPPPPCILDPIRYELTPRSEQQRLAFRSEWVIATPSCRQARGYIVTVAVCQGRVTMLRITCLLPRQHDFSFPTAVG